MSDELVDDIDDPVATITLDRPATLRPPQGAARAVALVEKRAPSFPRLEA